MLEENKKTVEEELPEELKEQPTVVQEEKIPEVKDIYPEEDNDLIEEPYSEDNAPVAIIYRCKNCGQILDKEAKDCWKCSSKDIEEVVEEDTKEVQKVLLQARLDRVEHELKAVKKNNEFLYALVAVVCVVAAILYFMNRG